MKVEQAKQEFIQSWGVLGTQWGINRTMAQIHALLLVSAEPLCADDVMEQLQISRGNTNTNIRELIDWQLVYKVLKQGERKEFFIAEKDIWKVAMRIIKERKKKEFDPLLETVSQLQDIDGGKNSKEGKAFLETMQSIESFAQKGDTALNGLIAANEGWFTGTLLKLFK
ncbi:MAG: transcriptional regulator [Chitinophagales bacterium]|nr:transcriptional regulator [Chitinophagales bacterium]